jgi:hypothetical protein
VFCPTIAQVNTKEQAINLLHVAVCIYSLSQYREFVKVRYAVRFGPEAGFASLAKGPVLSHEEPISVEEDSKRTVLERDLQCVPLPAPNLMLDAI